MKKILTDSYGRTIDYLRVSVTDRCNLSCSYCKTPDFKLLEKDEILSLEEAARFVHVAVSMGIRNVRITGGEPLIRSNVIHFINMLRDLPGLDEISLTTNGTLIERFAEELRKAGVNRLNISLDTLKRDRFARISQEDRLEDVLNGIEAAIKTGFLPVKLNVVVIKDVNDDEILDFARMTLERSLSVRFIEHMPIKKKHSYVSLAEIKKTLEKLGKLIPTSKIPGHGPARYVRYEGAKGTIGIIAPMSAPFCNHCNRLRLTVDGRLLPCLMSARAYDVKRIIRNEERDSEIGKLITKAVQEKILTPASVDGMKSIGKPMASIGG